MVGRCRLQHHTFVCMYGKQFFCAPNTEIYVCDMCEYQELPHRVLSLYDNLLKPAHDVSSSLSPKPANKKANFKKSSRVG